MRPALELHVRRVTAALQAWTLRAIAAAAVCGLAAGVLVIDTFAGSNGVGDGLPAVDAVLRRPRGIAHWVNESSGESMVLIADSDDHRVRAVDANGIISTFAGTGECYYYVSGGADGGPAKHAMLCYPSSITTAVHKTSGDQFIYVVSTNSYGQGNIRCIDKMGNISTHVWLTTPSSVSAIWSVQENGIVLYVSVPHRIVRVDVNGSMTAVIGVSSYGYGGFSGDGDVAASATLSNPQFVQAVIIPGRSSPQIYIADTWNGRVRRVSETGYVTTVAGGGTNYGDNVLATSAILEYVMWLDVLVNAATRTATLYVANAYTIFRVNETGYIQPILSIPTYGADAIVRTLDPSSGMARYLVAQADNKLVNMHFNGAWTRFAGTGTTFVADEGHPAIFGLLLQPTSTATLALTDGQATYTFFIEKGTHSLRCVDVAGRLRKIAGTRTAGFSGDGGLATAAALSSPGGVDALLSSVVADRFVVYIADRGNHRVRRINESGFIHTVAGTGIADFNGDGLRATQATLLAPADVAVVRSSEGVLLFICDAGNARIRKVDAAGTIHTIAGNGDAAFYGDGGLATEAAFSNPQALSVIFDPASGRMDVFVADKGNHRIRHINPDGVINTLVGSGTGGGFGGDGALATQAQLNAPQDVHAIVDVANGGHRMLYIADTGNNCIRFVNADGYISTLAGRASASGFVGDGDSPVNASMSGPQGVHAFLNNSDSTIKVFIADTGNNRIRVVKERGIPASPSVRATPSGTSSASPTISVTATITRTSSMTPSNTPSPSATWSVNYSATSSTTATCSISASTSTTASHSGSPSASMTASHSGSSSSSASITPSISASHTALPSSTFSSLGWSASPAFAAPSVSSLVAQRHFSFAFTLSVLSRGCNTLAQDAAFLRAIAASVGFELAVPPSRVVVSLEFQNGCSTGVLSAHESNALGVKTRARRGQAMYADSLITVRVVELLRSATSNAAYSLDGAFALMEQTPISTMLRSFLESPAALSAGVTADSVRLVMYTGPPRAAIVPASQGDASAPSVFDIIGIVLASFGSIGCLIIAAVWLIRNRGGEKTRVAHPWPISRHASSDSSTQPSLDAATAAQSLESGDQNNPISKEKPALLSAGTALPGVSSATSFAFRNPLAASSNTRVKAASSGASVGAMMHSFPPVNIQTDDGFVVHDTPAAPASEQTDV